MNHIAKNARDPRRRRTQKEIVLTMLRNTLGGLFGGGLFLLMLLGGLSTCSLTAQAAEATVPNKLFGIQLGAAYAPRELPVNRVIDGDIKEEVLVINFEPLDRFKYVADGTFLYAKDAKYEIKMVKSAAGWKVDSIKFSAPEKTEHHSYGWARSLCQSLQATFGVKPNKIIDTYDEHTCVFFAGDREFIVSSMLARTALLATVPVEADDSDNARLTIDVGARHDNR